MRFPVLLNLAGKEGIFLISLIDFFCFIVNFLSVGSENVEVVLQAFKCSCEFLHTV